MRYKLTIAYDGKNYAGFQSQKNALAIQDVLENVLTRIFRQQIKVVISSRTDAGVHSYGNVVHFDSLIIKDLAKLKYSINSLLPKDIHVTKIEKVSKNFHARYSVKNKTYEYRINNGEYDVFLDGYAYQCHYKLDVDKMIEASKLFIGTHDFSTFNTSTYEEHPNQVRTIEEFKISKKKDMIYIKVTSDGFLRNMVRIMVGTLIEVGRGKIDIEVVKQMLNEKNKGTRRVNADPNGLYLMKIRY